MQEPEFDKLMDGKPAKWADMSNFQKLNGMVSEISNREIQENETEIPKGKANEIRLFVKKLRASKKSERNIRRAVMRKFNISVFNN